MRITDLPEPIPTARLEARDLWSMVEQLKMAWRQDPTLALTSWQYRRLAQHLGQLPQPHRSKTRVLLGTLWTEEMPAFEVFVRLSAAISDWNPERKKAAA